MVYERSSLTNGYVYFPEVAVHFGETRLFMTVWCGAQNAEDTTAASPRLFRLRSGIASVCLFVVVINVGSLR